LRSLTGLSSADADGRCLLSPLRSIPESPDGKTGRRVVRVRRGGSLSPEIVRLLSFSGSGPVFSTGKTQQRALATARSEGERSWQISSSCFYPPAAARRGRSSTD